MAGSAPRVLVSIVNWNDSAATNKCLSGIGRLNKPEQPDIILVDNGSDKDILSIHNEVRRDLRSLKLVKNTSNLGFAGGHNPNILRGKEEGYDYIILLNPDTEIIDDKLFVRLTEAIESKPRALAANPTILSSLNPDRIWYGGGRMSLITGSTSHLLVGRPTAEAPTDVQSVSLLTGGCLAINLKRASLETLLLPEVYFVYWEDNEWCAHALKAGFELLYVPQVRLLHRVSSSLGIRSPLYVYYIIRNHLLFIQRNISPVNRPTAWLGVIVISTKYKFNILFRYKSGRLAALKALWKGWRDGLSGKTGEAKQIP